MPLWIGRVKTCVGKLAVRRRTMYKLNCKCTRGSQHAVVVWGKMQINFPQAFRCVPIKYECSATLRCGKVVCIFGLCKSWICHLAPAPAFAAHQRQARTFSLAARLWTWVSGMDPGSGSGSRRKGNRVGNGTDGLAGVLALGSAAIKTDFLFTMSLANL